MKKLKFNEGNKEKAGKCYKMHVGKNDESCQSFKVHNEVMVDVQEITYLGNIISNDGRNTKKHKRQNGKRIRVDKSNF